MNTTAGVSYKIGTALVLTNGKLTNAAETDKPLYIAGESAAADEKKSIICYPVFENMLFEAPITGTPVTLKAGTKVTLAINGDFADGVTTYSTDGVATVVDTRGAKKSGDKIFVRFEN